MSTSTSFSNPDNFQGVLQSEYVKPLMKYSGFLLFIVYFIAVFTMISRDPYAMDGNKRILYLFSVILPMVFFIVIILSSMEDQRYIALVVCMIIIIMFIVCRSLMPLLDTMFGNLFGYLTNVTELPPLSIEHSFLASIISKLLFVSIIVLLFSIVFSSFFHDSFLQREKIGIILYALFFIPCLVRDYVKYLLNEFKTTPTVVYVLIGIEITLIALYFIVPKLFRMIFNRNNDCIIRDPVYLDTKKTVSSMSPFYNKSSFYKELERENNVRGPLEMQDKDTPNKSLLRNYSISLWLTLNPPSIPDDDECMIFRVGDDNGTMSDPDTPRYGAPYIGYSRDRIILVCSNNIFTDDFVDENGSIISDENRPIDQLKYKSVSCEIKIDYQKWNNLVMNYRDNYVDVFLNGELVHTVSLKGSLPIYTHAQTVCIGSDSGKLHGAICEVCVYDKCLGRTQISQQYNLLNLKNPPVNNLT